MSGIPNIPTIPGADSFQGVQHHSSTAWRKFISGCGILTVVRVRSFYPCCTESTNRMADPQPQAITLSNPQQVLLHALLRQTSCPQALALRLRIVLGAAAGQRNDALAHALDCSLPTVRKWRRRWAEAEAQLAAVEPYPRDLRTLVATVLADAPRSGTPGSFTADTDHPNRQSRLYATPPGRPPHRGLDAARTRPASHQTRYRRHYLSRFSRAFFKARPISSRIAVATG